MECPHCLSANLKKSGIDNGRQIYTCKDCFHKHIQGAKRHILRLDAPKPKPNRPCEQCGNSTTNPKFCSKSCAAIYNNTRMPKRKPVTKYKVGTCKRCGTEIIGRRSVCDNCLRIDWSKLTLGTVANDARYQIHAVVRRHARMSYAESEYPKHCINCGYSKHYEVCHIRAINDFPLETMMLEVNDFHNLVALCPNCHWEFDNGLLSLEEIRAKNDAIF